MLDALLVLTNVPDRETATRLGRALIERRLAACVNIGSPVTSLYHWKGVLETATELPLWVKTTRVRYAAVEQTLRELHPYELPEIIAVSITHGLPAYLEWIAHETADSLKE